MSPLLLLFFVSVLLFLFRERIRGRLRLIRAVDAHPGPFSIPILGTTWQFKWRMEDFVLQLRDWSLYYVSINAGMMRMWMATQPILIALRHDYVKEILESNKLITKGSEYDILFPWLGTGLLTSTGDKWRRRRKLLTPAFHFAVLKQFVPIFDNQGKELVEILEKAKNKGEFDLLPYLKRCALDIICETAMGCCVHAQQFTSHPYVLSTCRLQKIIFSYQRMPWLWIDVVWRLSGYAAEYNHHVQVLQDFSLDVIRQRKEEYARNRKELEGREKKAFLDLMIEMETSEGLSDEDIREEVDTFMFEGHDTTSAAMGWTLWCVSHHMNVQQKIIEEIDAVFGDSDRECTCDDLVELKYLERVIKEALRLYPSVPNLSRSVEEDTVINGSLIPAGCTLIVSPHLLHRHPKLFPNPEVFNPDNFLEEAVSSRPSYSFIPFSAGPRNCIGQKFAILEEKTVLSWMFRRFTVSASIPLLDNLVFPEVIAAPFLGFPLALSSRRDHVSM